LGRFSEMEWAEMQQIIKISENACESFLENPFLQVMNSFN